MIQTTSAPPSFPQSLYQFNALLKMGFKLYFESVDMSSGWEMLLCSLHCIDRNTIKYW